MGSGSLNLKTLRIRCMKNRLVVQPIDYVPQGIAVFPIRTPSFGNGGIITRETWNFESTSFGLIFVYLHAIIGKSGVFLGQTWIICCSLGFDICPVIMFGFLLLSFWFTFIFFCLCANVMSDIWWDSRVCLYSSALELWALYNDMAEVQSGKNQVETII